MFENHNNTSANEIDPEEQKFIEENYKERLTNNDNPLSGEELYKESMKVLDHILKSDEFKS